MIKITITSYKSKNKNKVNKLINSMKTQTENIAGFYFDLSQKIYLHHPNNKFWAIQIEGKTVTYKVGKFNKDGQETGIEEVSKNYSTPADAKATAKTKILDKLTKGYFSKEAIKRKQQTQSSNKLADKKKEKPASSDQKEQKEQQKTEPIIRINSMGQTKKKNQYSGQYYEKLTESIKLQVNENRVKITKIVNEKSDKNKQGFEIRHFDSNQKAIQFCLEQEAWYVSQGYKPNHKKFTYTFIDQQQDKKTIKPERSTKLKDASSGSARKPASNLLSITAMTDEAISHRSRAVSSCKSDRSYHDDKSDTDANDNKPSKLGPSTSSCISVLLAETWSDDKDPTGWIMSEKLDGVRCFWTGSVMYSRNGNRFFPPKWFTKNWPKSQLDGELFIGRGQFSKTISAIKKNTPIDSEWENVRYLVFDAPALKQPFNKRIQTIQDVIQQLDNDYIKCHSHRQCTGYTDLFEQLEKVNKIEGQGLMLRDPASFYQNRRSKALLKVKTFHDDEAVILGYKEGTGRCQGMVGALRVRNTHGIQFEVGSGLNDDMRRKPPKIGTKITYKYQEFNKDSGKPRFPTFLRVYEQKI